MGIKRGTALVVCAAAAAAAGYSYLPSQAGKIRQSTKRRRREFHEAENSLNGEKVIYLTFDDGPHPIYTEKLLDVLSAYQIKGTFFVVGKYAEDHPELIARMQAEGHVIGLHSYSHTSAMVQTASKTREDFEKGINALKRCGVAPELYRPPWGHVNWFTLKQLRRSEMRLVLWDVMAEDWEADADEMRMQRKLLKRTGPGDIVCLHDRQADGFLAEAETAPYSEIHLNLPPIRMISALEKTIPLWLEQGYRFEVIRDA